jgi:hypothetical protein
MDDSPVVAALLLLLLLLLLGGHLLTQMTMHAHRVRSAPRSAA